MQRIDDATAASSLPVPEAAGTPGYFTEGNPVAGTPATNVRGSWLNMVQEELMAIVAAGGLTPSKTTYTQVRDAIRAMVGPGRLLRTSLYTNPAGTQLVSVDGGTATSTGATSWTPLAATSKIRVKVQGSGGAGGGCPATSAAQNAVGGGGGAGGWADSIYLIATIGSGAQAITIGAGAPASSSGGNGSNGNTSSFGSLVSCTGGTGGAAGAPGSTNIAAGGVGGTATGGNIVNAAGQTGSYGTLLALSAGISGAGGGSGFAGGNGGGLPNNTNGSGGSGTGASGLGGGGAGAANGLSQVAKGGGASAYGAIVIEEYA
ncbi:hypothetical protein B0G84_2322 [Paraburkholderia sp. BL8N3]|nr:hypothetical protein [Paraburkholderia sp. BL8N3]TCK43974.1 hypothetical protein B0G84_2322 [Paraburkholderia sp. BL8N3]